MNTDQFLLGQLAAKKGLELPKGAHPDFIRGYESESELMKAKEELK